MEQQTAKHVPIWYFIGLLLVVYGVLIFGTGIYELFNPSGVHIVLAELHASIWWGALMLIVGIVYVRVFAPGRQK